MHACMFVNVCHTELGLCKLSLKRLFGDTHAPNRTFVRNELDFDKPNRNIINGYLDCTSVQLFRTRTVYLVSTSPPWIGYINQTDDLERQASDPLGRCK